MPDRRIIDLASLRNPQPVQPLVINMQLLLPANSKTLAEDMKQLYALLQRISEDGRAAMEQQNQDVKNAQENGNRANESAD